MFFYERRKKKDLSIVLPVYDIKKKAKEGIVIKATALTLQKDDREVNKQVQVLSEKLQKLSDEEQMMIQEDTVESTSKATFLKLAFILDGSSIGEGGKVSVTSLDSKQSITVPLASVNDILDSLCKGTTKWEAIAAGFIAKEQPLKEIENLKVVYDDEKGEFLHKVKYR